MRFFGLHLNLVLISSIPRRASKATRILLWLLRRISMSLRPTGWLAKITCRLRHLLVIAGMDEQMRFGSVVQARGELPLMTTSPTAH